MLFDKGIEYRHDIAVICDALCAVGIFNDGDNPAVLIDIEPVGKAVGLHVVIIIDVVD